MGVHTVVGHILLCHILHTDIPVQHIEDGEFYDLPLYMCKVLLVLDVHDIERILRVHNQPLVSALGSDILINTRLYAHIFSATLIHINKTDAGGSTYLYNK